MNSVASPPPASARRRRLFRLLALLLGFTPLLGAEIVLRLTGYEGSESSELDPYIDFEDVRPLFEPTAEGMAIPKSRQEYFRPEQFAAPKPPGTFRIVCLGGSTVQGRPFAIETSFTTWLELALKAAEPQRDWEVINCGGVSYASYRLKPILREMLDYSPDLVILYTGQNEFLEERTYAAWRQRPLWVRKAGRWLEGSRVFRLTQSWATSQQQQDALPAEVDAVLDYRDGLELYHRDDRWHDAIATHYELNVGQMIDECRRAGVPMIVCNPVINLETPPFKSEPEALGDSQPRFDKLLAAATTADAATRVDLLEEAVAISPRNANAWFHLGISCLETHDHQRALAALIRAKDEDVCPLRMTESLYAGLSRAFRERTSQPGPALLWCDVRLAFTQRLPRVIDKQDDPRATGAADGEWLFTPAIGRFAPRDPHSTEAVTGHRWLVDHVHPSINGHQWIAHWLVATMQRAEWVTGAADPQSLRRRDQRYQQHLNELPPLYFERAKRRLEGLKRWSEGRAFKVRKPSG